jgi:hypothetical protein
MTLLEAVKHHTLKDITARLTNNELARITRFVDRVNKRKDKQMPFLRTDPERLYPKKYRKKKRAHGASIEYDYEYYKEINRELAKGDYDAIVDRIDQDRTNIADVAREIFPDHTDEGAQSQLRKILNHERPMTTPIARKLVNMIASGKVAVN